MLRVTYIPVVDQDYAERLRQRALRIDPAAEVKGRYPDPQGVVEWALPVVFAFVVGGISAAILQELGKDIYKGLKQLVVDSHDEARKSPYQWRGPRKEPNLNGPTAADAPASVETLPESRVLSPPLKVTLQVDEWGAAFSFVFSAALSPRQVADAYGAMPKTAQTILDYCIYNHAQLRSKRDRPQLYQGSMPDSIWEELLEFEVHQGSTLLHSVFLYDVEARIWGRVN